MKAEMDTGDPMNDFGDDRAPTTLERMGLPFVVEDNLAEPFESFFVVRVEFAAPVLPDTLHHMMLILDDWLQTNAEVAKAKDNDEPTGEAVQVGLRTVEFHIYGAIGDPDVEMVPMLRRLAAWNALGQPILLVELA